MVNVPSLSPCFVNLFNADLISAVGKALLYNAPTYISALSLNLSNVKRSKPFVVVSTFIDFGGSTISSDPSAKKVLPSVSAFAFDFNFWAVVGDSMYEVIAFP